MAYFIIRSGKDGTRVDGPLSHETVAERLRDGSGGEPGLTYYGANPTVLDRVPELDKGHFCDVPEGSVFVLRGEVVTREELTACPCGSGRAFKDCHGRDEDAAEPPPSCAHEKVYAGHMLTSDPPQHPWVCRKCKARGADTEQRGVDSGQYERIVGGAS